MKKRKINTEIFGGRGENRCSRCPHLRRRKSGTRARISVKLRLFTLRPLLESRRETLLGAQSFERFCRNEGTANIRVGKCGFLRIPGSNNIASCTRGECGERVDRQANRGAVLLAKTGREKGQQTVLTEQNGNYVTFSSGSSKCLLPHARAPLFRGETRAAKTRAV